MIIWYMIYEMMTWYKKKKENMLIWKMKKYDDMIYDEKKRKNMMIWYINDDKKRKERKYDNMIYGEKKKRKQEKIWSYMKWWYDIG